MEDDDPDNFPYDNVEFPVRKPAVRFTPSPRLIVTSDRTTDQRYGTTGSIITEQHFGTTEQRFGTSDRPARQHFDTPAIGLEQPFVTDKAFSLEALLAQDNWNNPTSDSKFTTTSDKSTSESRYGVTSSDKSSVDSRYGVTSSEKSTGLEPLLEAIEIDAIEADGKEESVAAPAARNLTLDIGLANTSISSAETTSHTSTVLFTNKTRTNQNQQENLANSINNKNVTSVNAQSNSISQSHSPITRLKSSMVESKNQTILDSDKTQTIIRPPLPVTWPFERNDFNTHSLKVLDEAYLKHNKSFENLQSVILGQGHALQKPLHNAKEKIRERLTYEQLLQGMLFDGERLLLNGHWVYFNRVEFRNEAGDCDVRPALGNGRACLTNKRLLLLVAEASTDAELDQPNDDSYRVMLTQREDVVFITLPMHCFRSVEMGVSVGAAASVKVTRRNRTRCGCLGRKKEWVNGPSLITSHNTRTVQLGVAMPPWGTNTMVVIHTHPELPLTLTRDFVSYVQSYAQQLH